MSKLHPPKLLFLALCAFMAVFGFGSAALAQSAGTDIIGIQGVLRPAVNEPFGNYFVVGTDTYGIVGQTPQVESQIDDYAAITPPPLVKIWGTLQTSYAGTRVPVIIASDILGPTAPTPTAPPARPTPSRPTATILVQTANVRSGPSTNYDRVGWAYEGETCLIIGRAVGVPDWYMVQCEGGATGWVANSLFAVQGDVSTVPFVQPPPPPAPTPTPVPPPPTAAPPPPAPPVTDIAVPRNAWKATYFNGTGLGGPPLLIRQENRGRYPMDFDWGTASPAPGIVPNDNWSARFEGIFYFEAGDYRFNMQTREGARVYIDGLRVLDRWGGGDQSQSNTFIGLGGGEHTLTVELFKGGGNAYARVWMDRLSGGSAPPPPSGGGSGAGASWDE